MSFNGKLRDRKRNLSYFLRLTLHFFSARLNVPGDYGIIFGKTIPLRVYLTIYRLQMKTFLANQFNFISFTIQITLQTTYHK